MATVLYPTGAIGDSDAIQAAIDALPSTGGSIQLKARKLADLPDGPKTDWVLGRASLSLRDVNTPGGSFQFDAFAGAFDAQPIYCDKLVTIYGDLDQNGDPETVVTSTLADNSAPSDSSEGGLFLISEYKSTIRDLEFKNTYDPIFVVHPFELVNCRFNVVDSVVEGLMDNRSVFPNIGSDDFSVYVQSLIKDCKNTGDLNQVSHMFGASGILMQDCEWDCTSDVNQIIWQADDFFPIILGFPFGLFRVRHVRKTEIKDCTFGNTADQVRYQTISVFSAFNDGEVSDVIVNGNTFTNQKSIYNMIDFYAYNFYVPGGLMERCSIVNNTIDGTVNGSWSDPFFGGSAVSILAFGLDPVSSMFVGDNDINTTYYAASPRPPVIIDGFYSSAFDCSVIGNDYKDSGQPKIEGDARKSCLLLGELTHDCLVKDTGGYPAGQGGAVNHVSNFGTNNRVVGEPANTLVKPAGIGQMAKRAYLQSTTKYGNDTRTP